MDEALDMVAELELVELAEELELADDEEVHVPKPGWHPVPQYALEEPLIVL